MASNNTSGARVITEEFKDQNQKYSLSKFEHDLYDEEKDKAEKLIRVKRFPMANQNEKWKIMIDGQLIFTIESEKITKNQRSFLQTVDGFNFMLSQAKFGTDTFQNFKVELKRMMDSKKPLTK